MRRCKGDAVARMDFALPGRISWSIASHTARHAVNRTALRALRCLVIGAGGPGRHVEETVDEPVDALAPERHAPM
ncbi:hypothetical protein BURKHO8Y_10332 [Burkholderia sp. 8Y]|nr:hypothetical protein BURKHO8Y_10332 [Burkholderia sp. 8Y]